MIHESQVRQWLAMITPHTQEPAAVSRNPTATPRSADPDIEEGRIFGK